jgi:hypothetical protein
VIDRRRFLAAAAALPLLAASAGDPVVPTTLGRCAARARADSRCFAASNMAARTASGAARALA